MTDEQIAKALECCIKSDHFGECFANKCPMISEEEKLERHIEEMLMDAIEEGTDNA